MSLSVELSRRTKKSLYHVVINPDPEASYRMTPEDWLRSAEILEQESGFTGQKRVMVLHEKDNRLHMHVAWERYNHETGRIISNRNSRWAQNRARKLMEIEFGHLRTPDRNLDRPGLRKLVTELWQSCPSGKDFIKALEGHGHIVAWSDERHPFRLVNGLGRDFDLMREIVGVRKKEVTERLKGIRFPDKKQAIKRIRQVQRRSRTETDRERRVRELKEQLQRTPKRDRGR